MKKWQQIEIGKTNQTGFYHILSHFSLLLCTFGKFYNEKVTNNILLK